MKQRRTANASNTKGIRIEYILNVTVREVEKDAKWEGEITGIKEVSAPIMFSFAIPHSTVKDIASLLTLEMVQITQPPLEAEWAREWFLEKCRFSIWFAHVKSIGEAMQKEARENFLGPILVAIGLLKIRAEVTGIFRIPVITTKKELVQFRSQSQIAEYVLSLNA